VFYLLLQSFLQRREEMFRLFAMPMAVAALLVLAAPADQAAAAQAGARSGMTRAYAAQQCRQERAAYYRTGPRVTRIANFQGCLRRHGVEPRRPLRI
jgi:hypothetical protein